MANPEHLDILMQGVGTWNKWREEQGNLNIDLTNANLQKADLDGTNLQGVNLSGADLVRAKLNEADLSPKFIQKGFVRKSNLNNALLHEASLWLTDFQQASLNGTSLIRASINEADFTKADLSNADFNEANVRGADFTHAKLHNVNFSFASINGVRFGNNDLSEVRGLELITHIAPSYIGISTVYKSKGLISEVFLRGCGVPDEFITYMRSLVATPIQFYSCFISYSSKDHPFAERLHADLQGKGVRCWFAPEDLKIGDRFRDRIDESIRLHDKLLIVLSENSVASPWVSDEVESAIEREHREGRAVLFPIKIDEAVMESKQAWAATIRRTRHIGDFTGWKEYGSYQKAFDRLLRDLKAEEKQA